MILKDEIARAIGAHGMWKVKIENAIRSGAVEIDPSISAQDNLCDFGKWIHANPNFAMSHSKFYQDTKTLHGDFHKTVGKILQCIKDGKKQEAETMMGPSGDFTKISRQLVNILMEWQKSI